jgi:type 1 glutamine amidotransferase
MDTGFLGNNVIRQIRIAALIGDFYHEPGPQRAAIEGSLPSDRARIDFFSDPAALPWTDLSDYDALVVAREAKLAPRESDATWMTENEERALHAFVRSGKGLVGLHSGLASYGHASTYGRILHGSFIVHPEEHPSYHLRSTGATHEILDGFRDFDLKDEMYFVRIDSSATTRLLEATSPDYGSSAAAWAHAVGAGRVFCFTPGHRAEVLSDPAFRSLLGRGIRWACGET